LGFEDYNDPTSPSICLILYLYTVEPAYYAEVSHASLYMDMQKLLMLGPYARAYSEILTCSERNREDVIP